MRLALASAVFALMLSSCSVSDCCSAALDFEGITETDADGAVVGEVDPDDWVVRSGSGGDASTVQLRPAWPNPATDETFIEVVLTAADDLSITLQRETAEAPIQTVLREGGFAAGTHRLRVMRPESAPGLYRIVVQGATFSTSGDVRFE